MAGFSPPGVIRRTRLDRIGNVRHKTPFGGNTVGSGGNRTAFSAPQWPSLFYGNPFDTLEQGNPSGNYNTFNDPILPSPVWNSAVEGAMQRNRDRTGGSKLRRKL